MKDQAVDTPIESLGTTQLGDRSHGEKKMEKLSMSVQFCPPTDQTPNDTVPKSFHARCRQSFADFRWRHWRGSLHLNDSVWAPRSLENHTVWWFWWGWMDGMMLQSWLTTSWYVWQSPFSKTEKDMLSNFKGNKCNPACQSNSNAVSLQKGLGCRNDQCLKNDWASWISRFILVAPKFHQDNDIEQTRWNMISLRSMMRNGRGDSRRGADRAPILPPLRHLVSPNPFFN